MPISPIYSSRLVPGFARGTLMLWLLAVGANHVKLMILHYVILPHESSSRAWSVRALTHLLLASIISLPTQRGRHQRGHRLQKSYSSMLSTCQLAQWIGCFSFFYQLFQSSIFLDNLFQIKPQQLHISKCIINYEPAMQQHMAVNCCSSMI